MPLIRKILSISAQWYFRAPRGDNLENRIALLIVYRVNEFIWLTNLSIDNVRAVFVGVESKINWITLADFQMTGSSFLVIFSLSIDRFMEIRRFPKICDVRTGRFAPMQ